MTIGNSLLSVGIEPTVHVFQASLLPLIKSRLPNVTATPATPTSLCDSLPERSVHIIHSSPGIVHLVCGNLMLIIAYKYALTYG